MPLFSSYLTHSICGGCRRLCQFSGVFFYILLTFLIRPEDIQAQPKDKEKEAPKPAATTPSVTRPDSLLAGRVTFKLPKDWQVQRPVKQGIAEGLQLGIPGKELDSGKHTANAAVIAEEQELLVSATDFSEWKLKRFTGERLGAIEEGANWRTVLSKDVVDGTTYIIVDRFGVKGKLVAYLRIAFPIVKSNATWERKLVSDYNTFIKTYEVEGETEVRSELVREEGKFRLVEIKSSSGDKKPKPRRRTN